MYDFIYNLWFIYNESIWWGLEKKKQKDKDETKEQRFSPFGFPPIPPSTKMKADCFPVSENTENKPDLP